ncbi:hypothetical protein [Microbacterium sp. gxy059]|uniref:hypothetical protein n=1 Tax=Microbacterium sp. gxy059 TaxID=2957199 RepID=UPI003D98556B
MAPFVLRPGALSPAELSAALLDGDVVPVGEAFSPVASIDRPDLRAATLGHLVPRGCAIVELAAAWVHGALRRPPEIVRLRLIRGRSGSGAPAPDGARLLSRRIDPAHVVSRGGTEVSGLGRTVYDLWASHLGEPSEAVGGAVRRLLRDPLAQESLLAHLEGIPRLPHARTMRSGVAALRAEQAQDDVTR